MSKGQMRAERRYFIGEYLYLEQFPLCEIKYYVRLLERVNFGAELKAYA